MTNILETEASVDKQVGRNKFYKKFKTHGVRDRPVDDVNLLPQTLGKIMPIVA